MLSEIIAKYPNIRIATEEDNDAILLFLSTISMESKDLSIRYSRSPNFFSFLNIQAERAITLLLVNNDNSLGGLAVMTSKKCIIDGKQKTVAYLSDVRIDSKISRIIRLQWRKAYIDVVENRINIDVLDNPDYFYAAILADNKAANRAFAKSTSKPITRKISAYTNVNILGKIFFLNDIIKKRKRKKSGLSFCYASKDDFNGLKQFLYHQNKDKKFGVNFTQKGYGELERRLKNWPEFNITSFFLVKEAENIIACVAPWGNSTHRKIIIEKALWLYRFLGKIMPLFGRKKLEVGEELSLLYLTALEVDSSLSLEKRVQIFSFLIDELFLRKFHKDYHLVSFFDFLSDSFASVLKKNAFITDNISGNLIQILSTEDNEKQNFLQSGSEEIVGFEIATS